MVIVGPGVMGAAAAWSAAKRDAHVLSVDVRAAGQAPGSSHGKIQATRESYFESLEYAPLARPGHRLSCELSAGGRGKVREAYTCIYTMTPDDHFIIDRDPASQDIAHATGFSGHGVNFAPVIGEVLADLRLKGETDHLIEILSASRF